MYTLAPTGVHRLSDDVLIRRGEPGWTDYLQWLATGGVLTSISGSIPDLGVGRPLVVTRFQARAALYNAGLLDAAEALMADADPIARLAWADAQTFKRASPTIAALAPALGLSDADIDAIFAAAALIDA